MDLIFDERIGRGAFGQVWAAADRIGRQLAVKFFTDATPSLVERLAFDHARALARVRHPAVVSVLALEEQPHPDSGKRVLAIIMERVPGVSLSLHVGPVSGELASNWLRDLGSGLQAIHDAGLIHGDLHDGNVMVHDAGATLLDILYTHTLADVGTRSARRVRAEDVRDLAKLCVKVGECVGLDRKVLDAAFLAADASSIASTTQPFLQLLTLELKSDSVAAHRVAIGLPRKTQSPVNLSTETREPRDATVEFHTAPRPAGASDPVSNDYDRPSAPALWAGDDGRYGAALQRIDAWLGQVGEVEANVTSDLLVDGKHLNEQILDKIVVRARKRGYVAQLRGAILKIKRRPSS